MPWKCFKTLFIWKTYKWSYNKPGGPSNSTARGLFDSNLWRVPRAISSYTSGLCKANSMVSSIILQHEQLKIKSIKAIPCILINEIHRRAHKTTDNTKVLWVNTIQKGKEKKKWSNSLDIESTLSIYIYNQICWEQLENFSVKVLVSHYTDRAPTVPQSTKKLCCDLTRFAWNMTDNNSLRQIKLYNFHKWSINDEIRVYFTLVHLQLRYQNQNGKSS